VSAKHTVAAFTDADPNARPRDYEVTIAWGDGTSSAGWVRRSDDGSFAVRITDGVGKGLDAKVASTATVKK
jgi:hypothetical protein